MRGRIATQEALLEGVQGTVPFAPVFLCQLMEEIVNSSVCSSTLALDSEAARKVTALHILTSPFDTVP